MTLERVGNFASSAREMCRYRIHALFVGLICGLLLNIFFCGHEWFQEENKTYRPDLRLVSLDILFPQRMNRDVFKDHLDFSLSTLGLSSHFPKLETYQADFYI